MSKKFPDSPEVADKSPPKDSMLKRLLKKMLPERMHKYLTPEVFIAWNVSGWFTLVQVAIAQNFRVISSWFGTNVLPHVSKVKDAARAAWEDLVTLMNMT